jgi:hypothetical protein
MSSLRSVKTMAWHWGHLNYSIYLTQIMTVQSTCRVHPILPRLELNLPTPPPRRKFVNMEILQVDCTVMICVRYMEELR